MHHVPDVGIYIDAQAMHTYNIDVYQNIEHDISWEGGAFIIASEAGGLLENVKVYNNIGYDSRILGVAFSDCCSNLSSSHPVRNIQIINNTLYNNGVTWGGGVAHYNSDAQNVVIRNNIVNDNLLFQIAVDSSINPTNVTIDHNLINGYRGNTADGETRGNDYVEGDPMFVSTSTPDFHLQSGSPAINKGSSVNAPAEDYDGNSRTVNGAVDIGAYEYIQSAN